ncbi:MAG: hypothetical protein JW772_05380 [Candidatus Diapherotrites archaeon]|nr:hypothetical protein [Candidatus Diapherotrites archaeon]
MPIDAKISMQVDKEFSVLQNGFIAAIVSPPEKYFNVNMAITKYFSNKRKMAGVYITMNKPYNTISRALEDNKIDTKKIFFVDAISGVIGVEKSENENCVTLRSPSALTELGIVISKVCSAKHPRFLMMDSLSTMLVYNNQHSTIKFIHYVTTQLRKCSWPGIIFSLEKDMQGNLFDSITQFCDKVIRMQ